MRISRRDLLQRIGAGAAVAAAAPSFLEAAADGVSGPLRLNRNGNPYGPAGGVIRAMEEAARTLAGHFPDEEAQALRRKIAEVHRVEPDRVVLGCGSTEILRMAVHAFGGPGKKILIARPTFDAIGRCAERAGSEVVAVPLTHEHSHDVNGMIARADAAVGLVYICNPNNPTGTLTPRRDLDAFIRQLPRTAFILIDEAYHHYVGGSADYASFIDRPVDDARVIVTRTFSSIHGLAGLRIGYAITARETAEPLAAHRMPEDVNVIAAVAARAALADTAYVAMSASRNADTRQEFFNQANARMVRAIDSQTNFVMLNTERSARTVIDHFAKNDVLVAGSIPSFDKYIRVSLGTPAAMREFWRIWDLMPGGHKMSM